MNEETVTRLLAGITAFYRPYPHDEAVAGIAEHIRAFWDPRMRAALAEVLAAGGGGLDPLAREAAQQVVGLATA